MAAIGPFKDIYRKPNATMYDYYVKHYNDGINFTKANSFYCGDSAGRKWTPWVEKDCYDHDIWFGKALEVKFYTPELYFLGIDDRYALVKDNKATFKQKK